MELTNQFRVSVPINDAWAVLTDLEQIAPCMPGAELQEVEGEEYRGIVKVKVGPITAQYKGSARFVETTPYTGRCCRPTAAIPGVRVTPRRPSSPRPPLMTAAPASPSSLSFRSPARSRSLDGAS